jgi:phosphoenolpyruvate-protein kinase (PTS system EI component)
LSLNPADIPAVKQAIREVDYVKTGYLVEKALACESAAQVRSLVS